jgi:hypothetical protein
MTNHPNDGTRNVTKLSEFKTRLRAQLEIPIYVLPDHYLLTAALNPVEQATLKSTQAMLVYMFRI